jgi:uncharacterized protein
MKESSNFVIALGSGDILERSIDDLQRKGPIDQARHNKKIKEAIRNDPSIISREDIITSDGKKPLRIPIRNISLPDFQFDTGRKRTGSGEGEVGDVVIPGDESGNQAGNMPGEDFYEADISLAEALEVVFDELNLPYLEDRGAEVMDGEKDVWNDVSRAGPFSNLHKKRTMIESMKRNAVQGRGAKFIPRNEDLRYRSYNTEPDIIEKSAVIISMRDVSGSMGDFERYVTRVMSAWMVKNLRSRYSTVETVFIAHHATAAEVNESTFFQYGESGGTIMSSAYELAIDIMEKRYNWQNWNIYPFHYTDGMNFGSDDEKCVTLLEKMFDEHHINLFGYIETHNEWYTKYMQENNLQGESTLESLGQKLTEMNHPKVIVTEIDDASDMGPALKTIFQSEGVEDKKR